MSDDVIAYYGAEARAVWRRQHPKDRRVGPTEGEIAIRVSCSSPSTTAAEVQAARRRRDIGRITVNGVEQ